jgi:hypothetical protein
MSDATALKIYKKMQTTVGPRFMFSISRKTDFRLVTYELLAKSSTNLHEDVAKISFIDLGSELHTEKVLPPVLLKNFFGLRAATFLGKGTWQTAVNCLPDRILTVKATKTNTNVFCRVGDVENAILLSVFLDMDFNGLGVPDLHGLKITALNPVTKTFVTENVHVTDTLLQKFNAQQLFREYLSSV